jgi:hypothetical protein
MIVMSGGCGGGGGGSDDSDFVNEDNRAAPIGFELADDEYISAKNVVINDNVYVSNGDVNYDETNDLISIGSENLYIGDTKNSIPPNSLKAGDILVVPPSTEYPNGFQRTITSISFSDGAYLISSEQAAMQDIFENVDFSMSVVLDGRFIDENDQPVLAPNRSASPNVTVTPYKTHGNGYGFKVGIGGSGGSVGIDVGLKSDISFSFSRGFSAKMEATYNWAVAGKLAVDEIPLLKTKPIPFSVWGIPCGFKVTPKLAFEYDLGSHEWKGKTSSSYSYNIRGESSTDGQLDILGDGEEIAFTGEEAERALFSARLALEGYLFAGVEDSDSGLSSGIAVDGGGTLFFKEKDNSDISEPDAIALYGKLDGRIIFRALRLKIPKIFFGVGLDFTKEYRKEFSGNEYWLCDVFGDDEEFALVPDSVFLYPGGSETFSISSNSGITREELTWKSSDESVATVNNGVVAAVKVGEAIITAAYTSESGENLTATASVYVVDNFPVKDPFEGEWTAVSGGLYEHEISYLYPLQSGSLKITNAGTDTDAAAVTEIMEGLVYFVPTSTVAWTLSFSGMERVFEKIAENKLSRTYEATYTDPSGGRYDGRKVLRTVIWELVDNDTLTYDSRDEIADTYITFKRLK